MTRTRGTALACLLGVLVLLVGAGCGGRLGPPIDSEDVTPQAQSLGGAPAVARPGALHGKQVTAELMVWRPDAIPAPLLAKIRAVPGVGATVPFSLARILSQDRPVTFAAVDPAAFRRFAPRPTAKIQEVWDRVADGEVALRATLRPTVPLEGDQVPLGNVVAHVGYYTDELVRGSGIDALVNSSWAPRLGMASGNAALLSVDADRLSTVSTKLTRMLGAGGAVAPLSATSVAAGMAVPTGGSLAAAVGSFSYTINEDGSINPDPRWINAYIRSEQVPILGTVRCNRAMLPQLRAALAEIVASGLAKKIHASEYGGCYVPRFIASDTSRGLSMHSWGLAVDLNVPGNLRGTVGEMDPQVVQIFARWGFAWGGTWRDPDPMHFELAQLVKVKG